MNTPAPLSRAEFNAALESASRDLEGRLPRLTALNGAREVVIYTYGAKGKELALMLRASGVHCLIYDNGEAARSRAEQDGFAVTRTLDVDRPLLVAAGQNQIQICASLEREFYTLAEALYAFDLNHAYGPARRFTAAVLEDAEGLFDIYGLLDPQSAAAFLDILQYRASLDVQRLTCQRPVGEMWLPPIAGLDIRSFCDIGAYDGDSLAAIKAAFPKVSRSFTIEPNPDLAEPIAAVAARNGIDNINYVGAAWSHPTRLSARQLFSGMLVIKESDTGDIAAETLDKLLGGEAYDYIKMDVEGTERAVLDGARESLGKAHCIAVAAYHLPHDFIELQAQLVRLLGPFNDPGGNGWRLAFAHYSQVFDDSIFYAWRSP
ncbi:MAG: FkbM family methyltransferase [Caulobacteraceae bacterium]